ncbi:pentapeptide repeat-containing protein [Yoonia sp. 208BN28-4]|uniref:pentapeptide repeat-containing protein n=1 Tax=Yoonia sp. 208BN28-4 TaxID=3126505 RepID=UPI0030B5B252
MLKIDQKVQETIVNVLNADTDNFNKLSEIAGLDPTTDFLHADLSGTDFTGADLTGYNFTGADLRGCIGLPSPDDAEKIGLILTDADL